MKSITIEGKERKEFGKRSTKHIRNNNSIPCVLYGGESNVHFYAEKSAFKELIYTPDFYKVIIKLGDKEYPAVLKEFQEHPVSEQILHIDFQELTVGKPIVTEIPVKIVGLSEGMKEGGRQILKIHKLKVRTLPKFLMEHIEIDVTNLLLRESVKVGDLNIEGYEFLDSKSSPVVTIEVQRLMKEDRILEAEAELLAEEEAAAAAEAEEGEGAAPPPEESKPAAEGEAEKAETSDKPDKKGGGESSS